MPQRPVLTTRRLRLVPQTPEAAQALMNGKDPGLPLAPGYPHADTLDGLRMSSAAGAESGGWFITLRDGAEIGPVIGDCGTKGWVDKEGRIEIGYGLVPPSRGRGFGTEAVGALVEWLTAQPEVRRITAEVEIGNLASRRLLERLGFVITDTRGSTWALELLAPPSP